MQIVNDNGCSWINDLDPRSNIKVLEKKEECEWLIIGAGYTGLSAARKLSQLHRAQKIILIDAQLAGEGAKGLKLSLYFTFKFKFFCIVSDLGSPKIDLPPNALGPNSILP